MYQREIKIFDDGLIIAVSLSKTFIITFDQKCAQIKTILLTSCTLVLGSN